MKVTERYANQAREEYGETLRKAGAHAITVDEVEYEGVKNFAVIAMAEKKLNLPKDLEIMVKQKKIKVPLVIKVSPKFKLE